MNPWLIFLIGLLFTLASPVSQAGDAKGSASEKMLEADKKCIECHAGLKTKLQFEDGATWTLKISESTIGDSIHGSRLNCADCHQGKSGALHMKLRFASERDYIIKQSETCKRCHFAHYTRQLDGIHFKALTAGDEEAPTCVDCHGAHDIQDPKGHRVQMDQKCAKCHETAFDQYENSVHGKALTEGSADHPGCIDCHGAHRISSPDEVDYRTQLHRMCGNCHSDKALMKKYDLNPNVLETYLDDFHGVSNQLYSAQASTEAKPLNKVATCTDCHGNHDVTSLRKVSSKMSREMIREKTLKRCATCHEGAPILMADAWLGHQEASLTKAPLVWLVKVIYGILIPLIIAGLVLHILLHLWRIRTHR